MFNSQSLSCCSQAAVDALSYVEEAIAVAPLFDEEKMKSLRGEREPEHAPVREPEVAPDKEPEQAPIKRRLSYADEDQGVLSFQHLH